MAPVKVDRKEKRRQIAQAAIEIFGEQGFERTRIEDVAVKAGVGKGTIYEYFRDKETLLKGAFEVLIEGMMGDVSLTPDTEMSAVETLKQMSALMIQAMQDIGDAYKFFLEYMLHKSRSTDEYDLLGPMLEDFRGFISAVIEQGIEKGEFRSGIDAYSYASAILAWYDGAIFHWIILPGTIGLDGMGDRFMDMILNGLLPPDGEKRGASR